MKKYLLLLISFSLIGLLLVIFSSCKKNEDPNPPAYQVPTVTTDLVTNITQTTAICNGNVGSDGGTTVTARGACWSTSPNPVVSDAHTILSGGTGSFSSPVTGLTANTPYFVRAYATNIAGTGYGNQLSFTTQAAGETVTDIDGNVYQTVIIGTQVWMASNLKTTRYNDGSSIPLVTDSVAWSDLTTAGFCLYKNDAANKDIYGALYNWFAVNAGNLAPVGWHVPTDDEWTTLTTYLGGEPIAGGKLKESGSNHWRIPNAGATNETGFAALPGGHRDVNGTFSAAGDDGYWWSVTEYSTTGKAWYRNMNYNNAGVIRTSNNKKNGHAVRCMKN